MNSRTCQAIRPPANRASRTECPAQIPSRAGAGVQRSRENCFDLLGRDRERRFLESRADAHLACPDPELAPLYYATTDLSVRREIDLLIARNAQLDQERRELEQERAELDHYRLDLVDRETLLKVGLRSLAAQVQRLQRDRERFADAVALFAGVALGSILGIGAAVVTRQTWAGVVVALFVIAIIAIQPAWHRYKAEREAAEGYGDVVPTGDGDTGGAGSVAGLGDRATGGAASRHRVGAR